MAMFGKIKIRKADALYSTWLRFDRKRCERCGSTKSLQVSHFYGRANEALRFDPLNTDCLCSGCHFYFTANPNEYVEYKQKTMGKDAFKELTIRAHTYKKRDDALILLWLSAIMKTKPQKENRQCSAHRMKNCSTCHFPIVRKIKVKMKKESGISVD